MVIGGDDMILVEYSGRYVGKKKKSTFVFSLAASTEKGEKRVIRQFRWGRWAGRHWLL